MAFVWPTAASKQARQLYLTSPRRTLTACSSSSSALQSCEINQIDKQAAKNEYFALTPFIQHHYGRAHRKAINIYRGDR